MRRRRLNPDIVRDCATCSGNCEELSGVGDITAPIRVTSCVTTNEGPVVAYIADAKQIDTNSTRNAANRTALVYTRYKNGAWTKPKIVDTSTKDGDGDTSKTEKKTNSSSTNAKTPKTGDQTLLEIALLLIAFALVSAPIVIYSAKRACENR